VGEGGPAAKAAEGEGIGAAIGQGEARAADHPSPFHRSRDEPSLSHKGEREIFAELMEF
jgi:hypothetical protein